MNDRELLELAAKAAGFAAHQWDEGMQAMRSPAKVTKYGDAHSYWNPLTDDGDALRLAVKLGFTIRRFPLAVEVSTMEGAELAAQDILYDVFAATRLAILRAAAEIGVQQGKGEGS